jgi:hypothetical protein
MHFDAKRGEGGVDDELLQIREVAPRAALSAM